MTFDLTSAQVSAGFTLVGERPATGALSNLPPIDAERAVELLADTGLIEDGHLTATAEEMFEVLSAPGRVISATVVTSVPEGVVEARLLAPREGGPYVAVAPSQAGYEVSSNSGGEAIAFIGAILGLSDEPAPFLGDAVELTAASFAALGALADLDEASSMPGAVRRALGKKPGHVVGAMRAIAPAGAPDPGSNGVREAGNWLSGAGLVVRTHEDRLQPTKEGRAILRSLRQFTAAASVTVDHVTEGGSIRTVSVSSIRTPERLLFGAWRIDEHGPVIALGEPGADDAATMLRSFIAAPNVFPPARAVGADSAGPVVPPAPEPERTGNPQWIAALLYGGLVLALAGAALGLTNGDDAGLVGGSADLTPTTEVGSTTQASTASTTTVAPVTTTPAVPTTTTSTIDPAATSSSSAAPTTTTTAAPTTTTTAPPPTTIAVLLEESFETGTAAVPLFGPSVVETAITAEGTLQITSNVGGVIPVTYPQELPATAEIVFEFFPSPVTADGFSGAVVLADDPSDGSLDHYLLVITTQANQNLTFLLWSDGVFGAAQPTTIPASAGYGINHWNTMRLVLDNGRVDAHINGVFVAAFADPVPSVTGWWGPAILGTATPGESVFIDNVVVR